MHFGTLELNVVLKKTNIDIIIFVFGDCLVRTLSYDQQQDFKWFSYCNETGSIHSAMETVLAVFILGMVFIICERCELETMFLP